MMFSNWAYCSYKPLLVILMYWIFMKMKSRPLDKKLIKNPIVAVFYTKNNKLEKKLQSK